MFELHALADDFNLNALGEDISGPSVEYTIEYLLLDGDGNFLVDGDGLILMIPETYEAHSTITLHAEGDDFNLNAE